jgi:rhamnogalacturonan acetylesterase
MGIGVMWIRCAVVLVGVGLLASAGWGAEEGALPVLHVVGDSTANNSFNGGRGWGNELAPLFDAKVIAVVNRARGGRSSRTYRSEGLWAEVLEGMKPGDYVLLQFGHNDPGGVGVGMDRGSLPGLGEETVTITNRAGRVETVHTYGWYLRAYIAEAREKGATPIVLTPTVRNEWPGGRVERGPGQYRAWAAAVARDAGALLIDHTALIADEYERQGQEAVRAYFGPDHTHTSPAGAVVNARCVVEGIRTLGDCGLKDYLPADPEDPAEPALSRPGIR